MWSFKGLYWIPRAFIWVAHPQWLEPKHCSVQCNLQNLLGNYPFLNSCSLSSFMEFPLHKCTLVLDQRLKGTSVCIPELFLSVITLLWYLALRFPVVSGALIIVGSVPWDFSSPHGCRPLPQSKKCFQTESWSDNLFIFLNFLSRITVMIFLLSNVWEQLFSIFCLVS